MRFSANVETGNWLLLKLLTLLIISSYIQSASIEKNADFYPKTSKFVKDLTKLTRHRRAVEGVTDNDVSILHPNISPIRSNLIRMFTRALGEEIDVQRSGNHRVPCGDCKLKKKMITIRKPNCSRTNVIIPICQGLCESWEVRKLETLRYKLESIERSAFKV